jgi:cysteinyl-tRNA synthetase
MKNLKIFNTFSGKKENFIPLDPNHIKIYACGPTVYNYAHIGNARMAVVFDTLVRVLRYALSKGNIRFKYY